MFRVIRGLMIIVSAIFMVTCASASKPQIDITHYADNTSTDYSVYLVNLEEYTTAGSIYHEKYIDALKGLARHLKDDRKINIAEHSIGFYYDRKLNDRERLYLGYDFTADPTAVNADLGYTDNARSLIQKYFEDMIEVCYLFDDIMKERMVEGFVLGVKWKRGEKKEMMNLWVKKNDIAKYREKTLTLKELVYRTVVTDTDGRIVRISL